MFRIIRKIPDFDLLVNNTRINFTRNFYAMIFKIMPEPSNEISIFREIGPKRVSRKFQKG